MQDVVLGVDVGTSGIRILAVNEALDICAASSVTLPAPLIHKGQITQDANIWRDGLKQALAQLDRQNLAIKAMAINGTSGTLLAIDEYGRPLTPGSMYNDQALAEHVAIIDKIAPQDTAARGTTSALARALAMPKGRLLHQADWLAAQFTGLFDLSDENNALKTGYDPRSRNWPNWIATTGLDMARLPKVLPAGSPMARINKNAAAEFHLPDDLLIVAGTTDGCAAFLASGASEPGDGVTSLGTTITLKLLSATPVFAPEFGIYSHRIGDDWLAGGASNSGGVVLKEFFTPDQMAELTKKLNPEKPTGLDYYPLPKAGERFPIADPNFPPRLSPRPTDDAIFLQAILEGMAAIEALGYQRLDELGASKLRSIRSLGGGSENKPWTKMRLNILNVPEYSVLSTQAALGTARLAWRGLNHAN